jgi:hypothetical protein
MVRDRDQIRDDIQATSENIVADAHALTDIEGRKQERDVSVEELETLSEEAENVAHDLARKASIEKRLVDVANAQDRLRRAANRRPIPRGTEDEPR